MAASRPASFDARFRRAGARLRTLHTVRSAGTGLSLGMLLGAALAAACWASGQTRWVPWTALAGAAGALVGVARALRRRWSDVDVALFLDARLGSPEVITSALAVRGEASERARALIARAEDLLRAADPKLARPRTFVPLHALVGVGVVAIGLISRLPAPVTPAAAAKPKGTELVRRENVQGLDRIEALERAPGLSESDAERLQKLARDAKQLRADLARGLPEREALSRLGKLREDIASERQRFSDRSDRAGLEAAANALSANEPTRRAAKALEEGDVVGFDEEMERLANRAEADARAKAKEALDHAREQARAKGGKGLAELLERQQKLFAEREKAAEALRELSRRLEGKLDAEGREALEQFRNQGDPRAAEQLAEALAEALEGLSEEERKRLLENLAEGLAQGGSPRQLDPEALAELGRRLSDPKAREELRQALRDLAKQQSRDAQRERSLDDAERGTAEAERGLLPVPLPGTGTNPGAGPSAPGAKPGESGKSPGGQGPGGGEGVHGEKDHSAVPDAEELRAKADAKLLPGSPLGTRSLGRAPARPGETANQLGTGQLGSVAAGEVSAVENSDVPEEYREHVGRYFQP